MAFLLCFWGKYWSRTPSLLDFRRLSGRITPKTSIFWAPFSSPLGSPTRRDAMLVPTNSSSARPPFGGVGSGIRNGHFQYCMASTADTHTHARRWWPEWLSSRFKFCPQRLVPQTFCIARMRATVKRRRWLCWNLTEWLLPYLHDAGAALPEAEMYACGVPRDSAAFETA